MKDYSRLENMVGKGSNYPKLFMFVLIIALVGIGLILGGINYFLVSAETEEANTPPVPPAPEAEGVPATPSGPGTSATPTVPITPGGPKSDGKGNFTFPAGWSMVSAFELDGYDLKPFKDAGLILYSFNDPAFPTRVWATFPAQGESTQTLTPAVPLGYYVYNPGVNAAKVALTKSQATSSGELMFARGWHLLYYPDTAATRDSLFENVKLTYSDGSTISALEATSSALHQASIRVFVVTDETNINLGSAVKELTGPDSTSTISKIPAESYFWLYLRRTKNRVVGLQVGTAQSATEKEKIDAWLKDNNYNDCGDPPGTVYAGGNCLFDEATGKLKDKYEYLIEKFPDKPWNR